MSVFEERAPLLKAAEKKMRNTNNSNDEFSVLDKGMDNDISMWNVQDGARENNVTYESYAFQAKFTCDSVDDGPINSCKPKASAERAASAKLAQAKGAKMTREEATLSSCALPRRSRLGASTAPHVMMSHAIATP